MLRNTEIPQGIKADRLGFPKKMSGGVYVSGAESSLLGSYTDQQLDNLSTRLHRSERRWKTAERIGQAMTAIGFLAPLTILATAGIEHTANIAYDPITAGAFNGVHALVPLLNHVGIHDMGTAYYAIAGAVPLASLTAGMTAEQIASIKSEQSRTVEKEQIRREITQAVNHAN